MQKKGVRNETKKNNRVHHHRRSGNCPYGTLPVRARLRCGDMANAVLCIRKCDVCTSHAMTDVIKASQRAQVASLKLAIAALETIRRRRFAMGEGRIGEASEKM